MLNSVKSRLIPQHLHYKYFDTNKYFHYLENSIEHKNQFLNSFQNQF